MKRWSILLALAALLSAPAMAQSVTSVRLTDTVVKGVGDVNLLKDTNAGALEAYRTTNGGRLVFGVDVNEAANGTEKASSQAVTVADAWLEVTFANGTTRVYGHAGGFWTETQALVARANETTRRGYYTLLGESGSSRITANSSVQSIFDSTLKIAVPDALNGVTSAMLHIRFVDTNVKLGDPEAFYDYTAGFEDLAILSAADALYIDTVLPKETTFRSEAPAMELSPEGAQTQAALLTPPPPSLSWVQQPAAGSYYIAAYEDLAPSRGDYDFNDLVVAYRYEYGVNAAGLVERMNGVAYLVARGSTYRHDWTLDLPLPAGASGAATCSTVTAQGASLPCQASASGGQLHWTAFQDTVAALPAAGANPAMPINTPAGEGYTRGPKASFSVVFATPITLPGASAGDPWLLVRTTGRTVRLGDRDANGYPFAMLMPSAWRIPAERQDMGLAYPRLASFIGSSGALDAAWYLQPAAALVRPWTANDWAW